MILTCIFNVVSLACLVMLLMSWSLPTHAWREDSKALHGSDMSSCLLASSLMLVLRKPSQNIEHNENRCQLFL